MKLLSVSLLVFVLIVYAVDPKASVAKKFTTMITNFLTVAQVGEVADAAIAKIVVFDSTQNITTAINKAMGVLSGSQYVTGMNLISKAMKAYGNMSAVNQTIQLCVSGATPVVLPLYNTLYNKKLVPKKDATADQKSTIVYTFIDSKFKMKFIKKIAKACAKKLSKDQMTKAKSVLNGIIDFSKLGL
ncbi:hypothetical protein M3Y98_01018700 [Aphelenchoides besseyi]|nr:hypothetical protein M3Y98_01018700 [Aphelenchoides besseyi]KAI6210092.1 hypothetical protein M3Y96_00290700 [Aphelenchoides besseyi]